VTVPFAGKKVVAIGILGSVLDAGIGEKRWKRWRPTVSLCRHQDLGVSRLELLYQGKFASLKDQVVEDILQVAPQVSVRVHEVDFRDPWDFEEVYGALHDFSSVYPWDTDGEEYLVHLSTGSHTSQICLFLLTESRRMPGRLVQTSPPPKDSGESLGGYSLIDLDLSRYDRIAARFREDARTSTSFLKGGIETRNRAFNALIDEIERVAVRSKAPILLTGPTGSGKSVLARRVYDLKKTRHQVEGPFVEVNCATIRGDAAYSALFGHVKGAFTGASSDRAGLLKSAHGGVLFLDEVGDLSVDAQAMLLRAIEEGRFFPLGSDREMCSAFDLIAGTNRELRKEVESGRFRRDLLARIDTWAFRMPGLAERREDVEPNLDYEIRRYAETTGQAVRFNREARERFLVFAVDPETAWPGNFRDLNSMVTRMATLAENGCVTVAVVDAEIARVGRGDFAEENSVSCANLLSGLLPPHAVLSLDAIEAASLSEAVRVCRDSRSLSEAGRKLYAASRSRKTSVNDADRLRKYLARYGLDWKRVSSKETV